MSSLIGYSVGPRELLPTSPHHFFCFHRLGGDYNSRRVIHIPHFIRVLEPVMRYVYLLSTLHLMSCSSPHPH